MIIFFATIFASTRMNDEVEQMCYRFKKLSKDDQIAVAYITKRLYQYRFNEHDSFGLSHVISNAGNYLGLVNLTHPYEFSKSISNMLQFMNYTIFSHIHNLVTKPLCKLDFSDTASYPRTNHFLNIVSMVNLIKNRLENNSMENVCEYGLFKFLGNIKRDTDTHDKIQNILGLEEYWKHNNNTKNKVLDDLYNFSRPNPIDLSILAIQLTEHEVIRIIEIFERF